MKHLLLFYFSLTIIYSCQNSTSSVPPPIVENSSAKDTASSAMTNSSATDEGMDAPPPPSAIVSAPPATSAPPPTLIPVKDEKTPAAAGKRSAAAPATPSGKDTPKTKTEKTAVAVPDAALAAKGFSDVAALDPSIRMDIRYATKNNFTKAQIYDCPACLLRPEAAAAVVKAHKELQKQGLGLKMFDCYRPRPYQQRLWDKVPNPDYVTPPAKGSMHSRGAAVDLTIVDAKGQELDMGTEFDFFGVEAHSDNMKLPKKVLENRRLLTETLEAVGFKGIRTEWWHFSFQGKSYELSDYVWPCK